MVLQLDALRYLLSMGQKYNQNANVCVCNVYDNIRSAEIYLNLDEVHTIYAVLVVGEKKIYSSLCRDLSIAT